MKFLIIFTLFINSSFPLMANDDLIEKNGMLSNIETDRRQFGPKLKDHWLDDVRHLFICVDKEMDDLKNCRNYAFIRKTYYYDASNFEVHGTPYLYTKWDRRTVFTKEKIIKAMKHLRSMRPYKRRSKDIFFSITDECLFFLGVPGLFLTIPLLAVPCGIADIVTAPIFMLRAQLKLRRTVRKFTRAVLIKPYEKKEFNIDRSRLDFHQDTQSNLFYLLFNSLDIWQLEPPPEEEADF